VSELVIYAAGNPDAYPIEYYDEDSGSYQGMIPQLLGQFAEEHGYILEYYDAGEKDQRQSLAENRQVDIISGCVGGETFSHTDKEGLTVLKTVENGKEESYSIRISDTAPSGLQDQLRTFFAEVGQETKTGMLVDQALAEAGGWEGALPALIGLSVAVLVLLTALITVIRKYRKKLQEAEASREIDPVTGLGNLEYLRRGFDRFLNDRNRILYSMFYFYIDTGKMERQNGGGETRNFLRYTASVLQEYAKASDILARTGEHGFALLRFCAGREETERWFQPILPRLHDFAEKQDMDLGIAAGVYPLSADDRSLNEILFNVGQCAQIAYREEQDMQVCDDRMMRRIAEDQRLRQELTHGLEHEEFRLYIQFYVEAHTHRIAGGEALSRWEHPGRGLLYPGQYIPLMERDNLIDQLDYYTLDKVCRFLQKLHRAGIKSFFVSCNFSRGTFVAEDFVPRCREIMDKYDFIRQLLIFELTESKEVKSTESLKRNIKAIKDMGIRIALDDFGEGFTSFFDLQEYALDVIKLDKRLIDNMKTKPGDSILRAMIQVGHELGMEVLAEGVETDEQVRYLEELSCDVIQGFNFHYPIPAREARRKLEQAAERAGMSGGEHAAQGENPAHSDITERLKYLLKHRK